MNKFKIAAILATAAASFGAQAAVLTQSAALVLETTEIHQTFAFAGFDTALGTLNGVSVTLDGRAVSSASFTNSAAQAQSFAFSSTLSLFLTGAGLDESLTLALFNHPRVPQTPVGTTNLGTVDKTDSLTVDATDLTAFTAPVTFTCDSDVSNTQSGGGGNIVVRQSTTAGCGVSLTYDYTAAPTSVPEPGALALVGLALAGVAVSRRRKA